MDGRSQAGGAGAKRGLPGWAIALIIVGVVVLLLIPCAGLVLGIALPGLAESREMAGVRASQRQMRGIAQAMAVYAQNHAGAFPPADAWQETLLAAGFVTPDLLVSPASDGDGEEYIWLAGERWQTQFGASGTRLVMYEDPDHHARGVVVLYADGRSDVVTREELAALLAAHDGAGEGNGVP